MKRVPPFVKMIVLIFSAFSAWGGTALGAGSERPVRAFSDFVAVTVREGDSLSSLAKKYLNDSSLDWFIEDWNEPGLLRPGQTILIPLNPGRRGGLSAGGYQTVPVLAYHNIVPGKSDKMTVSQEMFAQQMALLQGKGYRVIALEQLFDFLDYKRAIPPKSVALTFDDGWLSAYEIVFPLLKKYRYPAALFIYTEAIGKGGRSVSWAQLAEMAAQGISVESHGLSHRSLAISGEMESFREYFGRLEKELKGSREIIRANLNREPRYLAYPYGDTNSLVAEAARKAGYRGAFTIKRGGNPFFSHNFRVNRSVVYGDFTLAQFEKGLAVYKEQSRQ
jgi:peptidoglycan/xylan/chitin deacetylase (PgdA/CDA1 family)